MCFDYFTKIMRFFSLFVVILNFLKIETEGKDWCSVEGCGPEEQHIFCMFPDETPKCENMKVTTTDEFRENILKLHNEFRNKWAGGEWPGQKEKGFSTVANMSGMSWDDELEKLARRNLVGCLETHEQCAKIDRFNYGQNLYWLFSSSPGSEAENAVNGWVSEFKDFSPNSINPFVFSGGTGHFTQAAWANTYLLGCAEGTYKADPGGRFKGSDTKKVVCDYGPAGNFIGSSMYELGTPCSKCPSGRPCGKSYNNLCGSGPRSLSSLMTIVFLCCAIKGI